MSKRSVAATKSRRTTRDVTRGEPVISEAIRDYLSEVKPRVQPNTFTNVSGIFDTFCHFLNCEGEEGETARSQEYCARAPVVKVLDHLERFFRYCLLRELITQPEQRGAMATVIFDFCSWLCRKGILTEKDEARVQAISDNLLALGEKSSKAAETLIEYTKSTKKPSKVRERIEWGRHDVVKIDGNNIWLEIWSLPNITEIQRVGPIAIPETVAKLLELGWMIVCELARDGDGKWHILESGSVYPSLPF